MTPNENLSRTDLLEKLKTIFGLYQNTQEIQVQMDNFKPLDNYAREVEVPEFPGIFCTEKERALWRDQIDHFYEDAIEFAKQAHRKLYAPKEPEKPKKKEFNKIEDHELAEKQKNLGCLSYVAIGICVFFLLGAIVGVDEKTADTLPTILGVAAVAAVAFCFLKFMEKVVKTTAEAKNAKALAAHNQQQEEMMAEYNEKLKTYESESATYELMLKEFLENYAAWREVYIASSKEEKRIADQLEADRLEAVREICETKMLPAKAALNEANDLVPEKYLPVLGIIIDLIKSNRADGLKEAINLYEDLVYRERQLQLQREREERRRYEEQLHRQDEERRYQEEKRFREDQERRRRREEEQRQKDDERRHRDEMDRRDRQERDRQNEERRCADEERRRAERAELARKQEEERATRRQCNTCALVSQCSMAFGRPNCASYRPR